MRNSRASLETFEPFGQLVRLPQSDNPPAPAGTKLARVGISLFWTLVVIVVVARAVFGAHLFAFTS